MSDTPPPDPHPESPAARPVSAASPAPRSQPILEARGVTRRFASGGRKLEVLRGVDLALAPGDFAAVLGRSGSGKSTLLHLLGLLDHPDQGEILFEGRSVGRAGEAARSRLRAVEVGFVFQLHFLLPELNALENVMMAGRIAGRRARAADSERSLKERAEDLLARVGLGERLTHRPATLSGGERQRVAIARALLNRPRIVLCDEPTGNLDSTTAAGIHELLLELNRDLNQTFLIVTHEESMAALARRRFTLREGVLGEDFVSEPSGAAPSASGVAALPPAEAGEREAGAERDEEATTDAEDGRPLDGESPQ